MFVRKLPADLFEEELVPFLARAGTLAEVRLMMHQSGQTRGYAFATYVRRDDAKRAVRDLNGLEIRKGKPLTVVRSVDNCRLFVGGIPKTRAKEEIMVEMKKVLLQVIYIPF